MALITCPDCSKQISDHAPACPNCGRPNYSRPIKNKTVDAGNTNSNGLMGKPGTANHTLNVGCAAVLIGVIILIFLLSL